MSPAALPDDIETLKRLVIGRDEMIAKLMAEIARLKRWRFGRSAERLDAALTQLQLLLGDLPAPAASELPVQETVPVEESTQSPPLQQRGDAVAPRATCVARPLAARNDRAHAGELQLSGVRYANAQARRRHLRDARLHTGLLQGAAACTPEVLLWPLCSDHSAASALTPDRSRPSRPRIARAGDRRQVRRSLSAVSATSDLPALRRRSRSRDAGRVGGWCVTVARTAGSIARPLCLCSREAARR